MRALKLVEPKRVEIVEIPDPNPGAGEVLVRMEGCGLCGSNLPVWQGRPWFQYPLEPGAPGHEGWGRIAALGPGVTGLRPGQRVAVLSYKALAEYDVADAGALVALPEALDGQVVPGESLGCAINVFRRSDISAGQTVAIVGLGFIGCLVAQLAARAGARVIAISRRAYSLALARDMGAHQTATLEQDDGDLVGQIEAWTDGQLCDRVIEAVGVQRTLDVAAKITRIRGRLIIAGYHQDSPRQVDMQLWNWRGLDVVNAHERDAKVYVEGMRAAIDAIVAGELDPTPLYTHAVDLADANELFTALDERPDGFVKAQVML